MRKRLRLRKKLCKIKGEHNRALVKRKIEQIEMDIQESIANEQIARERAAVAAIKKNPKYFYKYVKNKSRIKARIGPLKNEHGTEISDPTDVANLLKQQYESVFSVPDPNKIIEDPSNFFSHEENGNDSTLTNIEITQQKILDAISTISNNAAAGPDEFPALLLKECKQELSHPLKILYQASLLTGEIPESMKKAKITPIFKGGSRSLPKNYRPVALTSHICKTLEKIIVKNIIQFLEDNSKMNANQHGFRPGRSCLSQLLTHQEIILTALGSNKNVDVVYLDFAKAFDKVDLGILLHKVKEMGITGNLGKWIYNFLHERKQFVAAEGALSQESDVVSGVPQGSVLGPILFLIHIADIGKDAAHARVASFADDTRVIHAVASRTETEQLQSDLQKLYTWADTANMSFNNSKFEVMRYGLNCELKQSTEYTAHNGDKIESKTDTRDLGVTMSDDATFSAHIRNVVKRARSQMGWVLRAFSTREELAMMTLYKSMIRPLLEYCCQLWNPWKASDVKALEGIQRTFTSKIISLNGLNYWQRLQKLGLYSLERRRERYIIIYIWKVINNYVPNVENGSEACIRTREHHRFGTQCVVQRLPPRAPTRVETIHSNYLTTKGPTLFNALPREIREARGSPDAFKKRLDKFLQRLPDEPKLNGYQIAANSNRITDQLALQRAHGHFSYAEDGGGAHGATGTRSTQL